MGVFLSNRSPFPNGGEGVGGGRRGCYEHLRSTEMVLPLLVPVI